MFDTHFVKLCIVLLLIYVKPFSSVSDRLHLNKTEHIHVVNSFGKTVHLRYRHFTHIEITYLFLNISGCTVEDWE